MKQLKITSDGTIKGTQVVDAESGERIAYVTRIEITLDANEHRHHVPVAIITVLMPELDISIAGDIAHTNLPRVGDS